MRPGTLPGNFKGEHARYSEEALMIDPSLIVFGIRALVRLVHEGQKAYEQYQRDYDILFPVLLPPDYRDIDFLRRVFANDDENSVLVDKTQHGALSQYWSAAHNGPDPLIPGAVEALYLAAVQIKAEEAARQGQRLPAHGTEVAGAILVRQWSEGRAPVGPLGRIVLTLADIGLEFVGTHASILGLGGNGTKLVSAIASNLADMIPDDGAEFGSKSQLAEHLIGLFLHAGLQALHDKPQLLVGQQHLQALIAQTLPPIIQTLPSDLAQQSNWRDVAEVLLGPAANVAMHTIAEHPQAFFGTNFAPQKAMGALTMALLNEASQRGLKEQFSEVGFLSLYRAALGVAVSRPELFVGRGDGSGLQIATALMGGVAETLKDAPLPLNTDLGADLALMVLETLTPHTALFLDPTHPWEHLAALFVAQVVEGLKPALHDPQVRPLLSQVQILELARTFLAQVVKTPAMLTGDNQEVQALIQSVALALVQDKNVLLSPEDWLQIATVVGQEVAANPQRLLKPLPGQVGSPEITLGTAIMTDLLSVATLDMTSGGRQAGDVLFGATLCEAMIIALRAASGNADKAIKNRSVLQSLVQSINQLVRTQPGQYGSQEWLRLFRVLSGQVLQSGALPALTEQFVSHILTGDTQQ
jgi:hypothetical protein